MEDNLYRYIQQFKNIKVLVIGDAMLDRYLTGSVERICREAPVPIVDIQNIQEMPGGAANAAVNLAALGSQVCFYSIVGNDSEGKILIDMLQKHAVDTSGIFLDKHSLTMTKTRIVAKNQTLLRIDRGKKNDLQQREDVLLESLIDIYPLVDAVLVSDYGYGVLSNTVRKFLFSLQEKMKKIFIIDAKFPEMYKDFSATAIKPNYQEISRFLDASAYTANSERSQAIIALREQLISKIKSDIIAVTLDTEGSVVIGRDGSYYQTKADPQPDSHAAGAGDTYTSALLLSLTTGASMQQAAEIAAYAASITVKKSATAFCSYNELQEACLTSAKYIANRTKLQKVVSVLHKRKKRIVFTNGCFDILHAGHINYLHQAKLLGDVLIVGINSDKSVREIKGQNRPVNTLFERVAVLSGLTSIDYIIPFEETTPISLIKEINPNFYVKGGDYTKQTLAETPIVEQLGGNVVIVPFIPEKSTTNIIKKITNRYTSRYE